MEEERLEIKTESTPKSGVVKKAQVLIRRKLNTLWDAYTEVIPTGEPCFSYDPTNGDCILKVGTTDISGNELPWNQLQLLRGRVDDGELE